MKTTIVLAMHGAPPNDFPRQEMAEYFDLRSRLGRVSDAEHARLQRRYAELEARVRAWPRTPENDPYHAAAYSLAVQLRQVSSCDVTVGFNEFCDPTLDEALDQAAAGAPAAIVVATPMMTRGGGHSEVEIPAAVRRAQDRHPGVSIVYAWPFEVHDIALFLWQQMRRFVEKCDAQGSEPL